MTHRERERTRIARYRAEHPELARASQQRKWDGYASAMAGLKLDAGCADCDEHFSDPENLEFDHVPERGEKINNVSRLVYRSGLNAALDEAEKCDVVCQPCHLKRTAARKVGSRRRGSGLNPTGRDPTVC